MHAAHGCAEYETQMIYAQAMLKKIVLCTDHVIVIVLREMGVEAIAWLTGFAVAKVVRNDDEIARRIEELAGPEQNSGKDWAEECLGTPTSAMKNENRVCDSSGGVPIGPAESVVMHAQFRKLFPGVEAKVA
jgi:hypothetical protein